MLLAAATASTMCRGLFENLWWEKWAVNYTASRTIIIIIKDNFTGSLQISIQDNVILLKAPNQQH